MLYICFFTVYDMYFAHYNIINLQLMERQEIEIITQFTVKTTNL